MNLAVRYEDDAADRRHVPVMVEEVCGLLSAHGPLAFVDVTVGTGGHAEAMLRATKARMLGLDRDAAAIAVARDRLGGVGGRGGDEAASFRWRRRDTRRPRDEQLRAGRSAAGVFVQARRSPGYANGQP